MRHVWIVSPCAMEKGIGHLLWCVLAAEAAQLSLGQCPPAACPCKGSSSSSSSRDCETLLIVLRSCLGSTLGPSPPAATVEMTEPEPVLSVACHCRCGCQCRPNRRITDVWRSGRLRSRIHRMRRSSERRRTPRRAGDTYWSHWSYWIEPRRAGDCFTWVSWTSCSSMILHDCGREAFAVGSQTVTTRGVIRLAW